MSERISKEFKELIIWQLESETLPNLKLSVGNKGTFTREELIGHVEDEDEIGKLYLEMKLKFMKDLMSGEISKKLAE